MAMPSVLMKKRKATQASSVTSAKDSTRMQKRSRRSLPVNEDATGHRDTPLKFRSLNTRSSSIGNSDLVNTEETTLSTKLIAYNEKVNKVVIPPHFKVVSLPEQHLLLPRLQVREFVLRFEKYFQDVPSKHKQALCNVHQKLEFLSFRHLTIALLKIIDYDHDPKIEPEITKKLIRKILQIKADDSKFWAELTALLKSKDSEIRIYDAHDEPEEVNHLYIMSKLIDLATTGECIRNDLENAEGKARENIRNCSDRKRAINKDWEKKRQDLLKMKPDSNTKDGPKAWKETWKAAQAKHKARLLDIDVDAYEYQRLNTIRSGNIGFDTRGNTYFVFHQRQGSTQEELGTNLIIEANNDCGPGCYFARKTVQRRTKADDEDKLEFTTSMHSTCPSIAKAAKIEDGFIDLIERQSKNIRTESGKTPDSSKSFGQRSFSLSTSQEVEDLIKWINYHAQVDLTKRPKQGKVSRASPEGNDPVLTDDAMPPLDGETSKRMVFAAEEIQSPLHEACRSPILEPHSAGLEEIKTQWEQIDQLVKRLQSFANYLKIRLHC